VKSDSWKILLAVNPMAGLIGSYRNAALGGPINWGQLALASGCAVLLYAYAYSESSGL
jgi:ABC-type polysaccharide/polyol phosphate export permease